jgi:hypothetical protein
LFGGHGGAGAQYWYASCTQIESHCVLQQNGSALQTALQHEAESQLGLPCVVKHDPAAASPQLGALGAQLTKMVPALVTTPPAGRFVQGPNATR